MAKNTNMKKALTREQILKATVKIKEYEVEGYGTFNIKMLSAFDTLELQKVQGESPVPNQEIIIKIISMVVCDEDGNTILSEDDVKKLDMVLMNSLSIAAIEFNQLAPDAVEKAKEALKKI